jgi:four helix bundle protein
MSNLPHAGGYSELIAYQKARQLADEIFRVSQGFPKEAYSLTSQVRRSSRAIGAQIAEAWAKRRYERHFIAKLTDADGEQQETQHWIEIARDCGYLSSETSDALALRSSEIGRLLAGMIAKADLFCGEHPRRIRDEAAAYLVD